MTVRRMKLGETYRTLAGEEFTVLECVDRYRGYETARCSDTSENAPNGIHRYNRTNGDYDNGRVTGTTHDYSDPRNLDRTTIGFDTPTRDWTDHERDFGYARIGHD